MLEAAQEVSKDQLALKVDTHQLQQPQPIPPHHSHQTTKLQEAATTTHKVKMTSQLAHREQLDTHSHLAHQPDQDSRDLKLEQVALPTQELKAQLVAHHTQVLKDHPQLVPHTQPLANPKDQLDLLPLNVQLLALGHNKDLEVLKQDLALEVSVDPELKVEAAAVDHHHRANKTKAKKEITQLFPENQKLTIQFSQKFQKHRLTATNKNSQDTTPMLKLVAKCSIFAL